MSDKPVFIERPSSNFNERLREVDAIILHYTAGELDSALETLTDPRGTNRVSAHYVVARDGTIYHLVDESKRAWHAGISQWNGKPDINSSSIGIEIINLGRKADGSFDPYTEAQIKSVIALCKDIKTRHKIKYILGHSDIAPGRKQDPGAHFPWKRLSRAGIGFWTDDLHHPKLSQKALLEAIGYDVTDPTQAVIAFQRHFYPDALEGVGRRTKERLTAVFDLQKSPVLD